MLSKPSPRVALRTREYLIPAVLLLGACVLVLLFWISLQLTGQGPQHEQFKRLFHLNGEGNVPAWYNSTLWLIAAQYSFRAHSAEQALGEKLKAGYWLGLSVGCVLLSLDEVASIHEALGKLLDYRAGDPAGIQPVYRWVWLAVAIVGVVLTALVSFMLTLPRRVAVGLVASGAIFLLGALGMETVGSMVESGALTRWPLGLNWNRAFAVEEFLEMAGIVAYLIVVQNYIAKLR